MSPAAEMAAVSALGPGTGITRRPASLTARTMRAPGSDTAGVPASLTSATRLPSAIAATIPAPASRSLCSCAASSRAAMPW